MVLIIVICFLILLQLASGHRQKVSLSDSLILFVTLVTFILTHFYSTSKRYKKYLRVVLAIFLFVILGMLVHLLQEALKVDYDSVAIGAVFCSFLGLLILSNIILIYNLIKQGQLG